VVNLVVYFSFYFYVHNFDLNFSENQRDISNVNSALPSSKSGAGQSGGYSGQPSFLSSFDDGQAEVTETEDEKEKRRKRIRALLDEGLIFFFFSDLNFSLEPFFFLI
jgi:hypothetical protein